MLKVCSNFTTSLAALVGKTSNSDASLSRYQAIFRGGSSALIAKVVSALSVLLAVPLTLDYLGPERYGLWVTLYSLIAWLSLVDLGLTNGLLNALSEAFGQGRRALAREYISVAFWGLGILALVGLAIISLLLPWLDTGKLLGINDIGLISEFESAVAAGAFLFFLALPFTIIEKIYIAEQRGEVANAWVIASTAGGFIGLISSLALDGSLVWLVVGFSGGQFLAKIASATWLFVFQMPDLRPSFYFGKVSFHRVFNVGAAFFVSQLATLMFFQSGTIIISSNLGPAHVTPFQVTWLLFSYTILPQQMVGQHIWATVGEAYAKNDILWIRKLFKRYLILTLAISFPVIIVFAFFSKIIIGVWAGSAAIPTTGVVIMMTVWVLSQALLHPVIAILGGTGKLQLYSLISVVAAFIALIGAMVAVVPYEVTGVVGSLALSAILLLVLAVVFPLKHALSLKSLGAVR